MKTLSSNLPKLDMSTSTTDCCPKFDPGLWDDKLFEFRNKPFIKDRTISFLHIPLNMSKVMARLQKIADDNDAVADDFIVLSQDTSPWHADHYYAVDKEVDGVDMVHMTGNYYAKVYEGDFREIGKWHKDLIDTITARGDELKQIYFYYTTCPKCAKVYNYNFVVGLAQIS